MEDFLKTMILQDRIFWTEACGEMPEVVLSTRVRLARNYQAYPFGTRISRPVAEQFLQKIRDSLIKQRELYYYDMDWLSEEYKLALFEKHLLSKELVLQKMPAGFLINETQDLCIMLNEEDHLRIQVFESGLNFQSAVEKASKTDDFFSEISPYAFDKDLGFYTSCPTNFGTGLRASVMVHLPGILDAGVLPQMVRQLSQAGYAVRGMYGEGTESWGGFFQISNQLTTGASEKDIISGITTVARNLSAQELEFRNAILSKKKIQLEDKVYRSYGLLKNARLLSQKEALLNISMLRLGVSLSLLEKLSLSEVNRLILYSAVHYLKATTRETGQEQVAEVRAEKIRSHLS